MRRVRVTRLVARAFGWVFVAVIAAHGVEAVQNATKAASHHDWVRVGVQSTIAFVVAALVIGVVVFAIREPRRARER